LSGIGIIAAVLAVEIKDLRRSIIAFGVTGFIICLSFIIQGKIDLSIVKLGAEICLLLYLVNTTGVEKDGKNR